MTTEQETAMNDLRSGVEAYIRYAASDPTWLSFTQGMDFDGRSWLVKMTAWEDYERDARIENYRTILIAAVREVIAADAGSFTAAESKLRAALASYDAARMQR